MNKILYAAAGFIYAWFVTSGPWAVAAPKPTTQKPERLTPGMVKKIPDLAQGRMVWLPPGQFTMGATKGRDNEKPLTHVRLTRGFWIMQTEVTQGQYLALTGKNPSMFKRCGLRCPVEMVSWNQAARYANLLSRRHRLPLCYRCDAKTCTARSAYRGHRYSQCRGWRLPTEAEWEYAARAGTNRTRYGALQKTSWFRGNSHKQTHPVALRVPNKWGLYDMIGNVWEWTFDTYRDRLPGGRVVDPVGSSASTYRIFRGGCWFGKPAFLSASYRIYLPQDDRGQHLGFRLIRSQTAPK